ncbi:MAG: hypothetical protein PHF00_04620 [Elusimicrobia bacterium]|nr:hypothetical protein [Elusimicrobiota bacterium]
MKRTLLAYALSLAFPVLLSAQTTMQQLTSQAKVAGINIDSMVLAKNAEGKPASGTTKVLVYTSQTMAPAEVKPTLDMARAAFARSGVTVLSSQARTYAFSVNFEAAFDVFNEKEFLYACPGWDRNRYNIKSAMNDMVAGYKNQGYDTAYGVIVEGTNNQGELFYSYKIYWIKARERQVFPVFGLEEIFSDKSAAVAEAKAAEIRRILRKKQTTALEVYVKADTWSNDYEVYVSFLKVGNAKFHEYEYSDPFRSDTERDVAFKARIAQLESRGAGIYYKNVYKNGYGGYEYVIYYIP